MDTEKRQESRNLPELKEKLREQILAELDFTRETPDEEILALLDRLITSEAEKGYIGLKEKLALKKFVFNSLRRYDILQDLLEDDSVTEIMVNGPENIFIEKDGRLSRFEGRFDNLKRLEDVAQNLAALSNRRINEANPIVDTRVLGCRVNIVLPPVSLVGPIITIRKFSGAVINFERLKEIGSITEEAADFLKKLVQAGYNILVSGGTGSGKTTFLNALSDFIPAEERIITIEDSAELKLHAGENLVRLETRNAGFDGKNEVSIRDLIRTSLRMRPDRIIVGEVRGVEAIDMLSAMNTGHDGSLSTIHANSAADVLSRLETMVLLGAEIPLAAVRRQIASAVDIIIQLGRLRDKSRRVLEICEVEKFEQGEILLNPLFRFAEEDRTEDGKVVGRLKKVGELTRVYKLERSGITKSEA